MSQSTPSDLFSPETDAFEAFLASHPDDLAAFIETPFGGLVAKVNELGFDAAAILDELVPSGLLDRELWISVVDLNDSEFLALTPMEYVERFPEHGAPLLASVLNSFKLSEDNVSLLSTAGGTNLSKGAKIGIGVTGGILGLALVVNQVARTIKTKRLANNMLKFAEQYGVELRDMKGFGGKATITRDRFGFAHFSFTANSFASRVYFELNAGILGFLFKQPGGDQLPGRDQADDHSSVHSSASYQPSDSDSDSVQSSQSPSSHSYDFDPFQNSVRDGAELESNALMRSYGDMKRELMNSIDNFDDNVRLDNSFRSNRVRLEVAPGSEYNDLHDSIERAKLGNRTKSLEVMANQDFVNDLEQDMKDQVSADLHNVMIEFDSQDSFSQFLDLHRRGMGAFVDKSNFASLQEAPKSLADELKSEASQAESRASSIVGQDINNAEQSVGGKLNEAVSSSVSEIEQQEEAILDDVVDRG